MLMMKRKYSILILLTIVFFSCMKKEKPVPLPEPGEMQTVEIEIGYPYLYQVYYDCESNTVVKRNTKYDWDIAFECASQGYHVLLNNATGMLAAIITDLSFEAVGTSNISNVQWKWDAPSGNLDSTAIEDWRLKSNIYIINRQYDDNGNHLGYFKLQCLSVNSTAYVFRFAGIDGSNDKTVTISKNPLFNFIHFSFNGGGKEMELEPPKNDWDLLFTNHHHKFDNLTLPFVLTQVLTNKHNGVKAAEANNNLFYSVVLKDTANNNFTDYWDEIGYDWKIRNSIDNSFTIDPNKYFLVKTVAGLYYKIKFIDFYNSTGKKGYPRFLIQKL